MESLRAVFFKIDRIRYFEIRHSLFDIRYSLFQSLFSDKLAVFQVSGGAHFGFKCLQQRAYFRMMLDRFKELLRSDVIPLFHDAQKPLAHNESQ